MNFFLRRIRLAFNPLFWFRRVYCYFCSYRFKHCGIGFSVGYPMEVYGGKSITIGNNFTSAGYSYLHAHNCEVVIGDNCSLNTNVVIAATGENITIGTNVMIAPNVVIRSANHGIRRDSPMRSQPYTCGEIVIEDDVWIGSNAVITAGVKLAEGTVVGAGAVVTKSTEPYTIVGGVPARKIGERV